MANGRGKIFCQRCRAANDLHEELCAHCGTRLMLVVEPSGLRFEEGAISGGALDEHLLERITSIENNVNRLIDKVGQLAEVFLKHSRSANIDHALLDTLVDVLHEAGLLKRQTVEAAWRARAHRETAAVEATARRNELCDRVISQYRGANRALFARLVREGFRETAQDKAAVGIRGLERAAALSVDNAPLNAFLGEHFFRRGRTALARDYLSRAFASDPENGRVRLLLGLACGDEGDPVRARELLSEAVRRGGPSFAAHCALGRLSAAESDWKSALSEFKLALAARPCPEAHYLLGLVNYQLGRDRIARRHLSKAVGLDASYGAAFYLLGLVYLRLGERQRAGQAFDSARAADADEPRYRAARRNLARDREVTPPSLFLTAGRGKRRLMTGGDLRLAAALQEDALGSPTPR
jgi:tetratricopeptide (TPR) repeat protein